MDSSLLEYNCRLVTSSLDYYRFSSSNFLPGILMIRHPIISFYDVWRKKKDWGFSYLTLVFSSSASFQVYFYAPYIFSVGISHSLGRNFFISGRITKTRWVELNLLVYPLPARVTIFYVGLTDSPRCRWS